ncbi:MAG TPA: hypothetical protein VGA76_07690 [Candidatus Dormibacteraeota bacterium]
MTSSQVLLGTIAVVLVVVLVCTVFVVIAAWRSPTAPLKVGATGLVVGLLIYFAARSAGGGLAGVVLGALLAWFAFEVAFLPVRGIWRARQHFNPRHTIVGGCLTILTVCGVGGLAVLFGTQLLLGVLLGAGLAVLNRRVGVVTLPRLIGLDIMPARAGTAAPVQMLFMNHVWSMAVIGLVCLVAGFAFAGLGAERSLESYSFLTDMGCDHPCGMVHGLWVQVMPDSQGNVVTRLDAGAVRLRVRFWDDVVGDRVASRDDFTVTDRPSIYYPVTDRPGCDAWAARTLHLDGNTGTMALCFAVTGSDNANVDQLVLEWTIEGVTAPILLGKVSRGGVGIDCCSSPSPSP